MATFQKVTFANANPRGQGDNRLNSIPAKAKHLNDLIDSLGSNNVDLGRVTQVLTRTDVDAQNLTITAARFLTGLIVHTSVTGGGTATLDTGVNLIAGLGLTAVGQSMNCTYVNDGNQTVTFAVATGTTITNVGNTVLTNASCTLICRMTAAATVDVTIADN